MKPTGKQVRGSSGASEGGMYTAIGELGGDSDGLGDGVGDGDDSVDGSREGHLTSRQHAHGQQSERVSKK